MASTVAGADVPALEELVDPACAPDFFCGLAANGTIRVLRRQQTAARTSYVRSCIFVQFYSVNTARLQIIRKYLRAAGGPAAKLQYMKNGIRYLQHTGHDCMPALQVSALTDMRASSCTCHVHSSICTLGYCNRASINL